MADEEPKPTEESSVATDEPAEESAEDAAAESAEAVADAPAPAPIKISHEALTAKSKQEAEENTGKPVVDVPYKLVSEEKLPHAILSLNFEVAAEDYQKQVNDYYDDLRKEIVLPGYRKGRAPVKLIRIRMGDQGDKEAQAEVATNVARQELINREFEPKVDAHLASAEVEAGSPLKLTVEVETDPTIELKEYTGLTAEVTEREITEEQIDGEVDRLRKRNATEEPAEKGAKIKAGDSIVIDLRVEGEKGQELKHLERENASISDYNRELPEELAKEITGKKVGDEVKAGVVSSRKNRRGEEIEYTDTYIATINEIHVEKLPELDDEFAKDLGDHDTLAELRDSIRKDLTEHEERRVRGASVQSVLNVIAEKNTIDAPKSMISEAQFGSIMRDSQQLAQLGLNLEQVVGDAQGYIASQMAAAEASVKHSLITAELAKIEKLEVTDEDLEKEIEKMAEEAGRKPLAVRARLEADKRLEGLRGELLERKVADFLLEKNTIEKVEPKPEDDSADKAEEPADAADED